MRPGQNKRMRGRNRRGPNPLTRSYESNGPDVKVRGTAQHIAEKYTQLARDAHVSGDPVMAESYLQHAEHYYRLIAAAQAAQLAQANGTASEDDEDDDFDTASDRFNVRNVNQNQQQNGQPGGERREGEAGAAEGEGAEGGESGEPREARPQGEQRFGRNRERNNDRFRNRDRDRGERGERGDRQNFDPNNRPRRPAHDLEGAEQPTLPAFVTAPPRVANIEPIEGGEAAPVPVGDEGSDELRTPFRTRRRRRTRGGREDGAEGGEGTSFETEGAAE